MKREIRENYGILFFFFIYGKYSSKQEGTPIIYMYKLKVSF